jgi:hypothetical protein
VGDSLGPWLHKVARRAASKARAGASKRRAIELRAAELGSTSGVVDRVPDDLSAILHEELDRLPERYRAAIVLCDLQGHSCEETARRLGCPVGTVGSRLSRGRERLRTRLTRRGLAPTAGLIAAALTREAIGAVLPPSLTRATVQGVLAINSGKATVGVSSAAVACLVEDVLRSLFMSKIRSFVVVVAVACGGTLAAGGTIRVFAQPQNPTEARLPTSAVKKPLEAEKDADDAFTERHKGFRRATVGNFRPLIEVDKGVRFQSREAILYEDGTVKLYRFDVPVRENVLVAPPIRHDGPIREFCILDNARLLITASDAAVKFWDGLTGEPKKTIEGQFLRPMFSSQQQDTDGRFATVDNAGKVVTLWDLKTLEPVGTIRSDGSPRLIGAGLSKDGKTLATIGEDHSVTLRDAADGKPFATLQTPTPPIARVFLEKQTWTDQQILELDDTFWASVRFLIPTAKADAK